MDEDASDDADGEWAAVEEARPHEDIDDTPTVSCSRCNRTWDLTYELDDLQVGNRALERFALDHRRHTGHFPDDVTPWVVSCRRCPDEDCFLSEQPARRWAEIHARHTRHTVDIEPPDSDTVPVEPRTEPDGETE